MWVECPGAAWNKGNEAMVKGPYRRWQHDPAAPPGWLCCLPFPSSFSDLQHTAWLGSLQGPLSPDLLHPWTAVLLQPLPSQSWFFPPSSNQHHLGLALLGLSMQLLACSTTTESQDSAAAPLRRQIGHYASEQIDFIFQMERSVSSSIPLGSHECQAI